jgi:hypothetical protein
LCLGTRRKGADEESMLTWTIELVKKILGGTQINPTEVIIVVRRRCFLSSLLT